MMNPFKKLQQRRQQQAAADRDGRRKAAAPAPPPGITIAVRQPELEIRQAKNVESEGGDQSLDTVLPPTSAYHCLPSPSTHLLTVADKGQSLIMPHLTRRFTLLRAPDGSLLSPDAMRAHLRAQRARARATSGVNGANGLTPHHFLTEEEENEIIDQLRRQAKEEGREFETETFRGPELWSSGYASGTDGFGSWGGSLHSAGNNLQSLAESLGDLNPSFSSKDADLSPSTSQQLSPTRRGDTAGGLFSGRSSERDMAYLRTLDKERKGHRLEALDEVATPDLDAAPADAVNEGLGSEPQRSTKSASIDTTDSDEGKLKRFHGHLPDATHADDDDLSSAEGPMPGDFLAAERRASQQKFDAVELPRQPSPTPSKSSGLLGVPTSTYGENRRESKLLTSLSPEAFKRVSTALEEVFGLMVAEGTVQSRSGTPVRREDVVETTPLHQSPRPATAFDSLQGTATSNADPTLVAPASDDGGRRTSIDSDVGSFASAVSQVQGKTGSPLVRVEGDRTSEELSNHDGLALNQLGSVHIEDGGLNIGSLGLGSHPVSVPPSDSNLTILAATNGHGNRDSTLTAGDRRSIVDDRTPVVSPSASLLPDIGPSRDSLSSHEAQKDWGLVERTGFLTAPIAVTRSPQEDSAKLGSAVAETDRPENGPLQVTSTSTARSNDLATGPRDSSASMTLSSTSDQGPLDVSGQVADHQTLNSHADSPTNAIGVAMASLGEAWSPRSVSHSPKASVASGHSRNNSSGRMDSDGGSIPGPNEEASLSGVRKHYRQHSRSATASSSENFGYSPRSSRAMSPVPVLSRTARSPSYFPPPSSGSSMQSYAAGFKPPSAVSPAAIAAAANANPRTLRNSSHETTTFSPYGSIVLRTRDSASTRDSAASPYLASVAGFSPGLGHATGNSTETAPTSYGHHSAANSSSLAGTRHSRSGSHGPEASWDQVGFLHRTGTTSSSGASHRPPALPSGSGMVSADGGRAATACLMPHPPSDPTEGRRWRATYGNKAADAVSIQTSSDTNTEVVGLSSDGEVAEEQDLWAQMDQALSSNQVRESRPVSSFPSRAAEDHLASAGVTFDQLVTYQDQLVKSAYQGQSSPPPPLPTTPVNQVIPAFPSNHKPGTPLSHPSSPSRGGNVLGISVDSARLEKARERARAVAEQRSAGYSPSIGKASLEKPSTRFRDSASYSQQRGSLSFEASPHRLAESGDAPLSLTSPASSSTHSASRATRGEVLYDVTTSHRPTSPPPSAGHLSSSGLPTLRDLSASFASQSDRQSMSILQAVEQAGSISLASHTDFQTWQNQIASPHASSALDHQSIASGAPGFETAPRVEKPAVLPDGDGSTNYAQAIGFSTVLNSPADIHNHPYGQFSSDSDVKAGETLGIPQSSSYNALEVNDRLRTPASPQSAWSETVENQESSCEQDYLRPNRTQLMDDIAARARAATRALKGIDDGSAPTPPHRTRTPSRRKSFRKVSKQISSPHLISTTQKMDHTVEIGAPQRTSALSGSVRSPSRARTPVWNTMSPALGGEAGSVPSVPALPGKGVKPSGAAHRRRSSSFGHSAHAEVPDWSQQSATSASPAPPQMAFFEATPAASPTTSPRVNTGKLQNVGQPLTASKSIGGSSTGGSLSRLMSKIRARKPSDVVATIEPYPTNPSLPRSAYHASSPALPSMSSSQTSRSLATRNPSAGTVDDSYRSPSLSGKQSLRSPTSSSKELPRIDSTAMPPRSGKKYRTPIVLKRDSEIRLPGDPDPPLEAKVQSAETQPSTTSAAAAPVVSDSAADQSAEGASAFIAQLPTSLSASPMPIQDRWEADAAAAAAIAEDRTDVQTTAGEAEPISQPASSSTMLPELKPAPRLDPDVLIGLSSDTTAVGKVPALSKEQEDDSERKVDQRKSLRDTIVRRTIIIPADINFDERRRSIISTASRRKSKKHVPLSAEDMRWNPSLTTSASSSGACRADDSQVSTDTTTSMQTAVQLSALGRASTPPASNGGAEALEAPMDSSLPTLPSSNSAGMSTLASQQSLMPSSASMMGGASGKGFDRSSRAQSSYAGSLYDLYIADYGEEHVGLSDESRARSSRMLLADPDRSSKMPETHRHIEVTERADGSVVWQVLAGLADRGSVYSDYDSRHSRMSSNGYGPRDRDSLLPVGFGDNRDSIISESYSELELARTPAGLTDEDSRSFFARPRGHRKSFSFDTKSAPPLPGLPAREASGPTDGFNPPRSDGSGIPTAVAVPRSASQAVFEMATSPSINLQDAEQVASPTRIVYHNDAQLASLLDLLARGKDSAKFEFQSMDHVGSQGGSSRPTSTWTKLDGSETLDADDIESHRSRVEAEIYTLLNQHSGPAGNN